MPKVVDHDERRRQIAAAVCDIAATSGLGDVSFRVVAAQAGVSVSLVQHYFGNKANLVRASLEIQSAAMDAHIAGLLAELGTDPDPRDVLRTVAEAFLPTDDVSRRSMLLYHGFAAAALTDPALRQSEMFTNGRGLVGFIAQQLARLGNDEDPNPNPNPNPDAGHEADATGLVSLLLGLSIAVLLEQTASAEAVDVLDRHLHRLVS